MCRIMERAMKAVSSILCGLKVVNGILQIHIINLRG